MADILLSGLCDIRLGDVTRDALQGDMGSIPFPFVLGKNGGIGFQLEGGLITVTATNPQIQVTFDRPMTYNGDYTPNPTGPFDIGQPVLTPSALALDIPVTVAPSVLNTPTAISPNVELVSLEWDEPVSLVTEVGWSITGLGPGISIIDVYPNPPNGIFVQITEGQNGATYNVDIPPGCVVGATGKVNLALSLPFVANGNQPFISTVVANSPTTFTIVYTEPMDYASATDVNNYSIPGLTIIGIDWRSDTTFTIRTSPMVPNTPYTVTVTGVMDAHGNTIS
jgi:hypothetical protein